jgi:hypothetical protein
MIRDIRPINPPTNDDDFSLIFHASYYAFPELILPKSVERDGIPPDEWPASSATTG